MVKERHVVYAHGHKYTNCLRLVINQPLFILVVVFFYAVYNKKISFFYGRAVIMYKLMIGRRVEKINTISPQKKCKKVYNALFINRLFTVNFRLYYKYAKNKCFWYLLVSQCVIVTSCYITAIC